MCHINENAPKIDHLLQKTMTLLSSSKNLKTINKIQAIYLKELKIFCKLYCYSSLFIFSSKKENLIYLHTAQVSNHRSPAKVLQKCNDKYDVPKYIKILLFQLCKNGT